MGLIIISVRPEMNCQKLLGLTLAVTSFWFCTRPERNDAADESTGAGFDEASLADIALSRVWIAFR